MVINGRSALEVGELNAENLVAQITAKLPLLRTRQLRKVEALVNSFVEGARWWVNEASDFASEDFVAELGDLLLQHHNASAIPLTKDKFEYAMVDALRSVGFVADKLPNGNPGEDIVVNGHPWSLKTQADRAIKTDRLHISKFMELGKGAWQTNADLIALRNRMFVHMQAYERILSLRCLSSADGEYEYELVEVPKELLQKSRNFPITFKVDSRQTPKPASCYVNDDEGLAFELYFDGGTERKLQVRNLMKRNCIVHARWSVRTNR